MINKNYQRAYLRAPLQEDVLFSYQDSVLKGKGINISEGGILLEGVPKAFRDDVTPFMVSTPKVHLFKEMSKDELMALSKDKMQHLVFRFMAKKVRVFEGLSPISNSFIFQTGFEFCEIGKTSLHIIKSYVYHFTENVLFLLGLFEGLGTHKEDRELLHHVLQLLNYSEKEALSTSRQKVLHDFQSLDGP